MIISYDIETYKKTDEGYEPTLNSQEFLLELYADQGVTKKLKL